MTEQLKDRELEQFIKQTTEPERMARRVLVGTVALAALGIAVKTIERFI